MIKRLYIDNYRCLVNFDLSLKDLNSALFIGRNGVGKSTIGDILTIFQQIGRGFNRVQELATAKDFSFGRDDSPMNFEIEVLLEGKEFLYSISFDLPPNFKELRVLREQLACNGRTIFKRELAQVQLTFERKTGESAAEVDARFRIDWHLVALPIIQEDSKSDPISVFKRWLALLIILKPSPAEMSGESTRESLLPEKTVSNIGAWFSGIIADSPSSYSKIESFLKPIFGDLKDISNPLVARDSRSLVIHFSHEDKSIRLSLEDLSDGEKCFMVGALILAANSSYGPLFCFWDEPDNFIAPSEVGHLIMALRSGFKDRGQFVATSHNPETIRRFSAENTIVLTRLDHLTPARAQTVGSLNLTENLVDLMIRSDMV